MDKNIKYYLYLSKVKIDMLWGQISMNDRESISAELKVNLGVLSAGIKSQDKEETIYSQLKVVSEYLRKNNHIGTLHNTDKFFKGTMDMSWQELSFYTDPNFKEKMVLFSGVDEKTGKIVGLVGSATHIIGMKNIEPASLGYAKPSFWMKISEELNPPSEEEIFDNIGDVYAQINYQGRRRKDGPPKQKLEFIAKTYISKDGFILGSPIYVAESD